METVAKNSPTHQPAAFNLGIVNLHMGNLEESNKWFKRAVELDGSSELGMRAQNILQKHTFPQ
jgi:Tfp pilus assembly protein PilF